MPAKKSATSRTTQRRPATPSAAAIERERSRAIQESIQEGLGIFDHALRLLEWNSEWAGLFGKGCKAGASWLELLGDETRFNLEQSAGLLEQRLHAGHSVQAYGQRLGAEYHFELSARPVMVTGAVTGFVVTVRDLTPLIEKTVEANVWAAKAQQHLRELAQLADLSSMTSLKTETVYPKFANVARDLLQASAVTIYLYDPRAQHLRRVAGSEAQPVQLELAADHPAALAFARRQPIATGTNGQQALAVSVNHQSKSLGALLATRVGEPFSRHEVKLLRLAAARLGNLTESASMYHDVNARRERWEAVFRFTDEGIVIFDQNAQIVGFNPAASQITGFSSQETIGRPITKILKAVASGEQGPQPTLPIAQVLGGTTVTNQEQLLETKSGDHIWTVISYSPILGNSGEVTSGLGVIRNLQKDREIEEIKSDFISIVSHELRTPLTAIKGFLSMVLGKDFGELGDKQFHYLSLVYQSNQRMIDLVEDLLNASNIESGKLSLTARPVALEKIVAEVAGELAAKAASQQVLIKVTRRHRLPLVLADESRLHQILLNLVDNAVKYSMPDSEVVVDCRVQGDELVTSISDRGVGISAAQADRLFTKFGRIYNPMSVQAGGTGLGLYIVKNLVESHGGQITVSARKSGGTKFTFTLPIAKQLPLLP